MRPHHSNLQLGFRGMEDLGSLLVFLHLSVEPTERVGDCGQARPLFFRRSSQEGFAAESNPKIRPQFMVEL
jgi:hypothetical protein